MKILFHVGVGNKDRPERWWGVCVILSNLARSMEALGHECLMYCHPLAKAESIFRKHILSTEVENLDKLPMLPDVVFTWNGSSEGDKEIVKYFGRSNCVFGELGFFDHYESTYFDFSGTNCKSQNIIDEMEEDYDEEIYNRLVAQYEKPAERDDDYIFVAMQDERDTNITMYSPLNTMNELLEWVCDLSTCYGEDTKILYKMHPKAPCQITVENPKLEQVYGDVHAYMKNARCVIGCNSTVLFECLLYHNRIITAGLGLSSRPIKDDRDRKRYVVHCYKKQIHQTKLGDPEYIKQTWLYKKLMEKYNAHT